MTSSDLWSAETAEQYDDSSAFMFAPDVLDPAVDFLPSWPATARYWSWPSAREGSRYRSPNAASR
jgi:hypothetical protein